MIRKRHLALGNKGLAVNSIQMLLLQLAPNAGFSKKVYTVVLAVVAVVLMVVAGKRVRDATLLSIFQFFTFC